MHVESHAPETKIEVSVNAGCNLWLKANTAHHCECICGWQSYHHFPNTGTIWDSLGQNMLGVLNLRLGRRTHFQQDDPKYTTRAVMKLFRSTPIYVLECPSKSPDLNTTEKGKAPNTPKVLSFNYESFRFPITRHFLWVYHMKSQ